MVQKWLIQEVSGEEIPAFTQRILTDAIGRMVNTKKEDNIALAGRDKWLNSNHPQINLGKERKESLK